MVNRRNDINNVVVVVVAVVVVVVVVKDAIKSAEIPHCSLPEENTCCDSPVISICIMRWLPGRLIVQSDG